MTNEDLFKEIQKMDSKFTGELQKMNARLDEVAKETRRNSVLLEEMDGRITKIAECADDTNRRVKNLENRADNTDAETVYIDPLKHTIKDHGVRISKLEAAAA